MAPAIILRELSRAKKQKESILLAFHLYDLGISVPDYPQGIQIEEAYEHLKQLNGLIQHYKLALSNSEQP